MRNSIHGEAFHWPPEYRHLQPYLETFQSYRLGVWKWEDLTDDEQTYYPSLLAAWEWENAQIQAMLLKVQIERAKAGL